MTTAAKLPKWVINAKDDAAATALHAVFEQAGLAKSAPTPGRPRFTADGDQAKVVELAQSGHGSVWSNEKAPD